MDSKLTTTVECKSFERNISISIYIKSKKTSEINPIHPVVKNIVEQIEIKAEDKSTKEMIFYFKRYRFFHQAFHWRIHQLFHHKSKE
jgi:hypothetical protein